MIFAASKAFLLWFLFIPNAIGFITPYYNAAGLRNNVEEQLKAKKSRASAILLLEPVADDLKIQSKLPGGFPFFFNNNNSPATFVSAFEPHQSNMRSQKKQTSMPFKSGVEYINGFGTGPNLLLTEKSRLKASKLKEEPGKADFLTNMAKARRQQQFSQRGGLMAHNSIHKTIKEILMGIS